MSEFRFLCPECGQKILGDIAYTGTQIACPGCQKTITIPAAVQAAPPPPPAPISPSASQPGSSSPATAASQSRGRFSALAIASLICSVFVPLGSIPGIICGHLAKARMRRDIFLQGARMANAGLFISYCVLTAMLATAGTFAIEQRLHGPVMVMRNTPEAIAAMQPRVVDEVVIGENEEDHDMGGMRISQGINRGKEYRCAIRGGSFSYMLRVLPDQPMTLNCRYWGGERKQHVFDISVDNQIIATQSLPGLAPGLFVDMEYKIPASLTRGKTEAKVEFRAHAGMTAGELFGCEMLKQ